MENVNKRLTPDIKPGATKAKLQEPIRLAIPRSPSDTRRKLMSMGTFYAKTKGLPESLYFLYCAAIIDAILELCPFSKDLHLRIVNQWDKPGCQSVITLLEKKLARCHDRNQYFIALGMALIEAEIPDNEDWKKQEEYIADWVRKYCNKASDVRKNKIKLDAETSIFLSVSLVFNTLAEYLKLNFDEMNEYRGGSKDLMAQHKHSRRRDKLVRLLRDAGFELHYGDKIVDAACLWVYARIKYKSLIALAKKESVTTRDILQVIKPFDKAVGYPRRSG